MTSFVIVMIGTRPYRMFMNPWDHGTMGGQQQALMGLPQDQPAMERMCNARYVGVLYTAQATAGTGRSLRRCLLRPQRLGY